MLGLEEKRCLLGLTWMASDQAIFRQGVAQWLQENHKMDVRAAVLHYLLGEIIPFLRCFDSLCHYNYYQVNRRALSGRLCSCISSFDHACLPNSPHDSDKGSNSICRTCPGCGRRGDFFQRQLNFLAVWATRKWQLSPSSPLRPMISWTISQ